MDEEADLEGLDEEYEREPVLSFPLAVVSVIKKRWGRYVFRVEIVSGIHKGRDKWVWTKLPKASHARYLKVKEVIGYCIPFEMPESEIISERLVSGIVSDTYQMVIDPHISVAYSVRQLQGS